jgi:hypothetical protein
MRIEAAGCGLVSGLQYDITCLLSFQVNCSLGAEVFSHQLGEELTLLAVGDFSFEFAEQQDFNALGEVLRQGDGDSD